MRRPLAYLPTARANVDRPFTDLYDTGGTGGFPGITFLNRPVVGGHFALLALERARESRKEFFGWRAKAI